MEIRGAHSGAQMQVRRRCVDQAQRCVGVDRYLYGQTKFTSIDSWFLAPASARVRRFAKKCRTSTRAHARARRVGFAARVNALIPLAGGLGADREDQRTLVLASLARMVYYGAPKVSVPAPRRPALWNRRTAIKGIAILMVRELGRVSLLEGLAAWRCGAALWGRGIGATGV